MRHPCPPGRSEGGRRRARQPGAAPALLVAILAALLLAVACTPATLNTPRAVVLGSGARLGADSERLDEIHEWTLSLIESITCRVGDPRLAPPYAVGWERPSVPMAGSSGLRYCRYPGSVIPAPGPGGSVTATGHLRFVQDPAIHVHTLTDTADTFPWATLTIAGDTARVRVTRVFPDLHTAYAVYAFLHLVHRQGRIDAWLPDAAGAEGYDLERAIVARVADVWLLGRAAFQLEPHPGMDALVYATEAGHLDAFLLTARPEDFPAELERWLRDDPDGPERYRQWFRSELDDEPPGPAAGAGTGR